MDCISQLKLEKISHFIWYVSNNTSEANQHDLHFKEEEINSRGKHWPKHFFRKGITMTCPLLWVKDYYDNNVKTLEILYRIPIVKVYDLVMRTIKYTWFKEFVFSYTSSWQSFSVS